MRLEYSSKYEGEIKTLILKKMPTGLGYYEDDKGNIWDVRRIVGEGYSASGRSFINARLVTPYDAMYSTRDDVDMSGLRSWKPYYYEVKK